MVRSVAGNLPEQVKNNQSVNTAAGNGGQKMSQYSWFTVYAAKQRAVRYRSNREAEPKRLDTPGKRPPHLHEQTFAGKPFIRCKCYLFSSYVIIRSEQGRC